MITIKSTQEFVNRLTHLFDAQKSLAKAGIPQDDSTTKDLLIEFLEQFDIPEVAKTNPVVGYIVTRTGNNHAVMLEDSLLFRSESAARLALNSDIEHIYHKNYEILPVYI